MEMNGCYCIPLRLLKLTGYACQELNIPLDCLVGEITNDSPQDIHRDVCLSMRASHGMTREEKLTEHGKKNKKYHA